MRDHSQPNLRTCACALLWISACAVDHTEPPELDAGSETGITLVIEREDAAVGRLVAPVDPREGDASTLDVKAVIATGTVDCTPLTLSIVGPQRVFQGDAVAYEARVSSETGTALEYVWSASHGDLSTTEGLRTEYTCSASGAAAITLRAAEVGSSDHCGTAMALALWCTGLPN